MTSVRKFLIGAAVIAVIATAVSMNRHQLYRLVHARRYHRLTRELKRRYTADLAQIEHWAETESAAFVEAKRDFFLRLAGDGTPDALPVDHVDLLANMREWAREVIRLHLRVVTTQAYASRLYPLERALAQERYDDAREERALAKEAFGRMREQGFPVDALIERVDARVRI